MCLLTTIGFELQEMGTKLCVHESHMFSGVTQAQITCHTLSPCMPLASLSGHKLIRLLSDSQARKGARGQILWRTGSTGTAAGADDQVEVYRCSYLSHLPSQVLVGGAVPVSVRASLIIRSTAGTPPSLNLQ